jgi:glutaredoxin 2
MTISKDGFLESGTVTFKTPKARNVFNQVKQITSIFLDQSVQHGDNYVIDPNALENSVKQLTNYLKYNNGRTSST